MKTKTKRYQTKRRKNNKAKWLLLAFFTINALTTLTVPYTLDVIYPKNDYFPQARVVKQEVKAEHIVEERVVDNETDREKVERVAKEYCAEKGLGDFCWKDLVAIAYSESRFDCKAVGDKGKSHGCFQIHRGYHKHITVAEAQDISFAVEWTLNRLVAKGYPKYRSTAIMLHNGTPNTSATKAYLQSVNNYANSL